MIIIRGFSRELVKHSPFESGEPSLDDWLKKYAGQSDRLNDVRTFLAADEERVRIAGYYSTVTYTLTPEDVGETFGHVSRYSISAVLMARLAVDRDYQGTGIGQLLLFDALSRLERTSHNIGFKLVVVDALHEDAACFYLKYGFRRFLDHELKLYLTTKDLQATFAENLT